MKASTLLVAILAIFVVGCQPGLSEKNFQGTWTSKITISDAEIMKQIKAFGGTEAQLPQAKKMLEGMTVKLSLNEDKTYSLDQGMGGAVEGKWSYADMKVKLVPEKAAGKTKAEIIKISPQAAEQMKDMVFTADKEGKSLTGSGPQGSSFSFSKQVDEKK